MNNYDKILWMFCEPEHMKEGMRRPYIFDDMAIATDAHMMVWMGKDLTVGDYWNNKGPNSSKIIDKNAVYDFKSTASEVQKAIDKVNKYISDNYSSEKIPCQDCLGLGAIDFEYEDVMSEIHTLESQCPICEGKKFMNQIIHKETGEDLRELDKVIKIGQRYFQSDFVDKILRAARMLDVEEFNLRLDQSLVEMDLGKVKIVCMAIMVHGNERGIDDRELKIERIEE